MSRQPKPYKLKKRNDKGGVYYIIDKATGKSRSSKTTDKHQAEAFARVQYDLTDDTNVAFHKKTAEMHLAKCNPEWTINTWDMVINSMKKAPRGQVGGQKSARTVRTITSSWGNKCWNRIRHKRLIDTLPSDFQGALNGLGCGLVAFGKTLHRFAFNHGMMPYQIMGDAMWPKVKFNRRSRAITEAEHVRLVKYFSEAGERVYRMALKHHPDTTIAQWQEEWVNYLWLLWFTAASNSDAANMKAENILWDERVIAYKRDKWQEPEETPPVCVAIAKGGQLEKLLKALPAQGNLFPLLTQIGQESRCRVFKKARERVGIKGRVTIHGYRFGFAERAKKGGMSVEDRMISLGHANYKMTHHYDKHALVTPQSIEVLDGGLKVA
jgi:hypothetical protein